MPDPITTVVTVISEHPQAAAAIASIYGVAKPFLTKILGPGAEELGEIGRDYIKGRRAKNAERTLADADKLLAEAGREPQVVPLNVAVPLLEAASLQEEPGMAARWAALLANAADPAQQVGVHPSYSDILRQLTYQDTQVLCALYRCSAGQPQAGTLMLKQFDKLIGLPYEQLLFSIDNLLRLRLLAGTLTGKVGMLPPYFNTPSAVVSTALGLDFMKAVTPPTP